jgi:CelD/BcsL family acetyltransferase involved in cellulose biosynthesis
MEHLVFTAKLSTSPAASSAAAGIFRSTAGRMGDSGVQQFNPVQHRDWDELLARHPHHSFFHGAAWAKLMESTYGFTPTYFATNKAGEIQSLLPLMEVDSWLTGRRGVALPFTDNCQPLSSDDDSFGRVVRSAMNFGRDRGWRYIELRGGREMIDGASPSLSFYGHQMKLVKDHDLMFAGLSGSVRRAIRKAVKSGVTVEISRSLEAVRTFHSLQCKTRKLHGLPPQSFAFFRNIYEYILRQNLGMVALARHEGRLIAAAVHFNLGHQAIYKYGASDRSFQHLRGNNLVMWEAIKWHAHNGATVLDLGRTSLTNEGVRRFKLGWGVTEKMIEYVKYDLRRGRFVSESDESFGWYNRCFQMMPVFLSRLIGAGLYRHWA